MTDDPQFPEPDLTRLADGSLSPERQRELRAQIQGSPALSRELAEQERAVALLRSTSQVTAPDSLRARLEELTAHAGQPSAEAAEPTEGALTGAARPGASGKAAKQPRRRPRFRLGFGVPALAGAVALAAVVAVLLIGNNGSSGPTLHQTARVALASATLPPPSANGSNPAVLNARVDGIPFPDWGGHIGWPAVGQRTDTIDGQRVHTVFYGKHNGTRIGYAIVAGSPVAVSGGKTISENDVHYTLFDAGGARAITWRRDGHTCVIAGRGVSDATLTALASADEGHSVASWSPPARTPHLDTI
jgi:anti-sigma factor RsiW